MSRRTLLMFSFLIVGAIILQVALIPAFVRTPFKPDLLLVIVVFMALRSHVEAGAPLAWLLGMIDDVFSGLYLGLNATSFLVLFLIIRNISVRLYADSAILFVLAVAAVTVGCLTLNMLLIILLTASPGNAYSMVSDIIPLTLVNAFVASLASLFPGFDTSLEPS